MSDGLGDLPSNPVGVEAIDSEVKVREGNLDARNNLRHVLGREEVEGQVLGASGVLQNGQDGSHGTPKIIGVEGHGDMDMVSVPRATGVAIPEGGGLPEDGDLGEGLADDGTKTSGVD